MFAISWVISIYKWKLPTGKRQYFWPIRSTEPGVSVRTHGAGISQTRLPQVFWSQKLVIWYHCLSVSILKTSDILRKCYYPTFKSDDNFLLPLESVEKVTVRISVLLSQTVELIVIADILPPSSQNFLVIGKFINFSIVLISISVVVAVITTYVYLWSCTIFPRMRTALLSTPLMDIFSMPKLDKWSSFGVEELPKNETDATTSIGTKRWISKQSAAERWKKRNRDAVNEKQDSKKKEDRVEWGKVAVWTNYSDHVSGAMILIKYSCWERNFWYLQEKTIVRLNNYQRSNGRTQTAGLVVVKKSGTKRKRRQETVHNTWRRSTWRKNSGKRTSRKRRRRNQGIVKKEHLENGGSKAVPLLQHRSISVFHTGGTSNFV